MLSTIFAAIGFAIVATAAVVGFIALYRHLISDAAVDKVANCIVAPPSIGKSAAWIVDRMENAPDEWSEGDHERLTHTPTGIALWMYREHVQLSKLPGETGYTPLRDIFTKPEQAAIHAAYKAMLAQKADAERQANIRALRKAIHGYGEAL